MLLNTYKMGLVINDGFINTFDYAVNFNLNSKIVTVTDLSTYNNTAGVSIIVTIVTPNLISLPITVTVSGTGTASIPTLNGGVVYGYYTISGVATDSVTSYTLAKTAQNICKPTQCDTTQNSDGCLSSSITFLCANNKLIYQDKTSYTYESINALTVIKSVTLIDPNNIKQVNAQNVSSFSLSPIVNGKYSLSVSNIAIYDFGGGVTVTIYYQASNQSYTAACDVNLCDVRCAYKAMYEQWKNEVAIGSDKATQTKTTLDKISILINLIESGIACGDDTNDQVVELEKLANVSCACGCGTTNPNSIICSCTEIVFEVENSLEIEQTTAGSTTTVTLTPNKSIVTSSGLTVTPTTVNNVTTYNVEPTALVWTALTPAAGWSVASSSRLEYTKDALGNVYVRGKLTRSLSATTTYTFGTLPVNFRPSQSEDVASVYSAAAGVTNQPVIIDINTSGIMSITTVGAVTTAILSCNLMFNTH